MAGRLNDTRERGMASGDQKRSMTRNIARGFWPEEPKRELR